MQPTRGPDGRRLNGRNKTLSETFARIFPERASFELRDEDLEVLKRQLQQSGQIASDSSPHSVQEFQSLQKEAAEIAAWKAQHPCLLQNFPNFFGRAKHKRIAVFLDYDGTLTPIVNDPDRAFMSNEMRQTVQAVACVFPTAIISGRGREKVEAFVKLKELFYAGSHGMDIVGPKVADDETPISFQAAGQFAPIMDEVFADLQDRIKHIKGASVEHNKFCVSVHFRNCESDVYEEITEIGQSVLAAHKNLKATRGRKVLEIRPQVDWNKGHALSHLLQSLSLSEPDDVLPIYIGDDRTDEDAFAVLSENGKGIGILVSTKVKETMAVYRVRDPEEVRVFLQKLVQWGQGPENPWHEELACKGWRLNLEHLAAYQGSDGFAESGESLRQSASRPPVHPRSSFQTDRRKSVDLHVNKNDRTSSPSKDNENSVLASVPLGMYQDLPSSPFEAPVDTREQPPVTLKSQ